MYPGNLACIYIGLNGPRTKAFLSLRRRLCDPPRTAEDGRLMRILGHCPLTASHLLGSDEVWSFCPTPSEQSCRIEESLGCHLEWASHQLAIPQLTSGPFCFNILLWFVGPLAISTLTHLFFRCIVSNKLTESKVARIFTGWLSQAWVLASLYVCLTKPTQLFGVLSSRNSRKRQDV